METLLSRMWKGGCDMVYKVHADGILIYSSEMDSLQINDAKLSLEMGKTGLFEFTVYHNHPFYDFVQEMRSLIEVQRDNDVIFSGRVFNIKYGFYNEKQVSCEGELAFLLDSLIAPHVYASSFSGYLSYVVQKHNEQVESTKHFQAGRITVADFIPFNVVENLEYVNALETLNKRMVERSGGYLHVRHENGIRYLDLLSYEADANNVSTQDIKLGKNLIDIKRESNSEEVFSAIVPLGAKMEGTELRIDIKPVNSGLPYIVNEDAEALYGRIYRQVIFDNITYEPTLLNVATDYLSENYAGISSVEITAADLSATDSKIDSFKIGQFVMVRDNIHFAYNPQKFLIRKMTIDILNPANTKITIGKTKKGLTESIIELSDSVKRSTSGSGSSASPEPEPQQPYLIEHGTSGIFKWAKFSDGTCEFFGKIPVLGYAVNAALGNWFRGDVLYTPTTYAYPFQMTEAPAVEMTFQTRNGLGGIAWVFSETADTAQQYLPQCYIIRPTAASGIYGNLNIIGRGKL